MDRRFFKKSWKSCTTKNVQGLLSADEVARRYKEKKQQWKIQANEENCKIMARRAGQHGAGKIE